MILPIHRRKSAMNRHRFLLSLAAAAIGADRYERTEGRVRERNGARPKLISTRAGDVELRIPKLRKGSFFPSILEPAGGSTRPCMRW